MARYNHYTNNYKINIFQILVIDLKIMFIYSKPLDTFAQLIYKFI